MTYRIEFGGPTTRASRYRLPSWARRESRDGWVELRPNPLRSVPGVLDVHPYSGSLWVMRVGRLSQGGGYRGVCEVSGTRIRFWRFGARPPVSSRLGKDGRP